MGGDDDAAALAAMRGYRGEQILQRLRVEPGGRLVEQPKPCLRGDKTRQRQAPPFAGGEVAARPIGARTQAERLERGIRAAPLAAPHLRPEGEILARSQRRFQRVLMADEMEAGAMRRRVERDG